MKLHSYFPFIIIFGSSSLWGNSEFDFFEKKIRPVLAENCYECHSEKSKKVKANLFLDRKQGWIEGGDSGPVIIANKPEDSLLMKAIGYHDNDLQMPPKGKLPESVMDDFSKWILMGAPDPRDAPLEDIVRKSSNTFQTKGLEEGRKYWAFKPVVSPKLPTVRKEAWIEDPIDRFVLEKLESRNLKPALPANQNTLLRRVYFDLIGLPPSPEQIDQFLNDDSADAYSKLVDQLLNSPRFGERWGRHWLDVARYSDTTGGGRNKPFPSAPLYRDYVVQSYNEDKPFNQFASEQIAGDLLDSSTDAEYNQNLTATGFLALGPHNYELQDKALLRMEIVDEQLSSVGRAFLGVTMGCARCHDHPFDPIPTDEYYSLAGIFRSTNSVVSGNVGNFVERELRDTHANDRVTHLKRKKNLEDKLKQAESKLKSIVEANKIEGILIDDEEAKVVGKWISSTSVKGYFGRRYLHDASTKKGEKSVTFPANILESGLYEVQFSYTSGTNRSRNTPVSITHDNGIKKVMVDQTKSPPISACFISLGTFQFAKGKRDIIQISTEATKQTVIVDAVRLLPKFKGEESSDGVNNVDDKKKEEVRSQQEGLELLVNELKSKNKAHQKNSPPKVVKVMSVLEHNKASDWHVHRRGDIRNLGPIVKRGFLAVATPQDLSSKPKIPKGASGRLQLANWITSPRNPLTSRVYVNRVWQHLFGRGIVESSDNFGEMGGRPTHPGLLDHLAVSLMENGWSTKELIRKIMLSSTYRMSSTGLSGAVVVDPENKLFFRQNRRRLEAEAIRDSILTAAGGIDSTQQEANQKRSIFLKIDRNRLPELFNVFDYPNPGVVSGNRNDSTVPTQALFMMNNEFVINEARTTAERILSFDNMNDEERLVFTYNSCLGREPREKEKSISLAYLKSNNEKKDQLNVWSGLIHGLFACIDFRFLN